ncbi:uncharacterized protein [Hetaerina americana]|uniref:uncharacterized protein n=1 Tax=Hetaerina americana TaxID=62018 RepID=UPI003A7F4B2A
MGVSVAVIGAGASGLCAARHLLRSPFRFRVFERSELAGGTWNYSEGEAGGAQRVATSSAVYRDLRTDIPCETMEFPDFPMERPLEHEPSYIHHSRVKAYLERYAKENNLLEHIEFHKEVQNVAPVETGGATKWKVSILDMASGDLEEDVTFDAIMVCNGHFNEPWVPEVIGMEEFVGQVLHSCRYREPEAFAGQRVVLWGASSSACDIALQVSAVAHSVTICHRPTPWLPSGFPQSIKVSANIISAYKEGFTLEDGTTCKADTLIYCTGYEYSFPFLSPECKIEVNDYHVTPLYKHLINIEYPSMCLVGLPQMTVPFIMFHFQVQYFLKVLEGSVALPSTDEMRAEGAGGRKAHHLGPHQWAYFKDLASTAHLKPLQPVIEQVVTDSIEAMLMDVAHFKRYRYTLADDGTFTKVRV